MDLVFLFNLGTSLLAFKDAIKHAAPGDELDVPQLVGLRIFGRRVRLKMTFQIAV